MPIRRFRVPLDNVGRTELVESSNRINAVSITKLSALAECVIDLGNNQLTSTIDRRGRLVIDKDVPLRDVSEGLAIVNETAQAGLSVWLTVSYARKGELPAAISYESAS